MMIAQNPVLRAVLVVTIFWYSLLFLFAGLYGVHPWRIIYILPQSVLISAVGCAIGFGIALLYGFHGIRLTESGVRAGSRMTGATITLGGAFALPKQPASKSRDAVLEEQPWWPAVAAQAPVYADAIRAVFRVMAAIPKLPASPYPGGHGGRTLIEHSLAVATQVVIEAKTWKYEGQKDKRGNIRIPLQGQTAHHFTGQDVPLLLLAGLAHDIGKIDCYAMAEGEDATRTKGPVLRVVEAKRMHDTEGARLLRRIPEVMNLPLADRTALLTAIGYYHHPFAIPISGWVTDRVRSLTELLAKADVAVGIAEGHTMLDADERMADDEDEAEGSQMISEEELMAGAGLTVEELNSEEEDLAQLVKSISPAPKPAAVPPPAPASTPASTPALQGSQKREIGMFMDTIRRQGAINGTHKGSRIGWKHSGIVYVLEPIMRKRVMNLHGSADPLWAGEAFADDPNGSPYTLALLEQLSDLGILITEHAGQQYSPRRSIFFTKTKSGGRMAAILLHADKIPGLGNVGNADPIEVLGPLWGKHQAKKSQAEVAATEPPPAPAPVVAPEPAEAPSQVEDQGSLSFQPAATNGFSDLDDDDLPFSFLEEAATAAPEQNLTPVPAASPEPAHPAAADQEPALIDPAPILASVITTPDFLEKYEINWRDRDGSRFALVKVDSGGGRVLSLMLDQIRESQPNIKFAGLSTVQMAVSTDSDGNPTEVASAFLIQMPDEPQP